MAKSKKGGRLERQRSALALLEARYEEFKAAKEDKDPWTTFRHGRLHKHAGRSYDQECQRLANEIDRVKRKIDHRR